MQQLTNAEEQLMEHFGRRKLKIYFRLFRAKTKNDNGCHFTEEDDR
jgi:hypothetical protein